MAAGQDRQADHVGVLVAGRRRDLLGREADARVDDLHAGVAGGDGDLLGAVGVAVEAGLGDEQPGRAAGHGLHPLGDGVAAPRVPPSRRPRRPTPVGARYSPNTSRSAPAHSPVVPPAWARAMVAGMMFSPLSAARRSSSSARLVTASSSRAARQAPHVGDQLVLDAGSTFRMLPVAAERRRRRLGEAR